MTLRFQYPSEEVLEEHFRQLGITKESLSKDVASLQAWMAKEPHLPHNVETKMLERFLINSKNSMQRTKSKLDSYYTARARNPDVYIRDPLETAIRKAFDVGQFLLLPKPTPQSDRVVVMKLVHQNAADFDGLGLLKLGMLAVDSRILEETCISYKGIIDYGGFTVANVASLTPVARRTIELFVRIIPMKISGYHILNVPPYLEPLIRLALSIMGSKLAQRVVFHQDMESLHDYIPKDILPLEYGGTYPATADQLREFFWNIMLEKREWILEQNSVMADESKRPGRTPDELRRMEGSFRKIEID